MSRNLKFSAQAPKPKSTNLKPKTKLTRLRFRNLKQTQATQAYRRSLYHVFSQVVLKTRLGCKLLKLSLHLGHLGRIILFYYEFLHLRLNHFNWFILSGFLFLNISYVLNAKSASIYIPHNLEKMEKNMGQTFGEEKYYHIGKQHWSLLVHTTLSLNNYTLMN